MAIPKFTGEVDFSDFSEEMVTHFLKHGLVVLDNSKKFEFSLQDVLGKVAAFKKEPSGLTRIVFRAFNVRADKFVQDVTSGKKTYELLVYNGKLETFPGSDIFNTRLSVATREVSRTSRPITPFKESDDQVVRYQQYSDYLLVDAIAEDE